MPATRWQQRLGAPAATAGFYGRDIIARELCCLLQENLLEHQSVAHVSGLFKHISLSSSTALFHISSPQGFNFKGYFCTGLF